MYKILITAIIVILSFSFAQAKKDIRKVKSIEFKNLKYVSKYEIIDSAGVSLDGDLIVIDINSLSKILSDMSIIKSFEIFERDKKLVISVKEKDPVFSLYIVDEDRNIPVELNKEFQIITADKMYIAKLPLIFISKEEIDNNSISLKIKKFLSMINDIQKDNIKIMNDILEIEYMNPVSIKVMLKGRKTVFFLKPCSEAFNKLNYAAGYFDMIKYYPDSFTILNGYGIVK